MFRVLAVTLVILLLSELPRAGAAPPANIDEAETAQASQRARLPENPFSSSSSRNAISAVTTFAPPSPSDSDIGEQIILKEPNAYDAWSVYADSGFFWTSNARLLRESAASDTYFTTGINVNFLPYLGNNFFLDFSGQFRIYRYIENPDLDFNYTQGKAGLIYVIRELADTTLFINYQYDLLTSRGFLPNVDEAAQTYAAHTLAYGVRKAFIYSRGLSFYASYTGEFTLGGRPGFALTNAQSFLVGSQVGLTRFLNLDVYYRFTVYDFRQNNRIDVNNLIGGGITLVPVDWLSVQAITTLAFNHSNESFFSYFAATLGGSLSLSVKF